MGNHPGICVLALACILTCGCVKQNSLDESMRGESFRHSYESAYNKNQEKANSQLISRAKSAMGVPYVRGGTTTKGFDCSGFVCWTYKSVGVDLPRTAQEQSVVGQRITRQEDMRAGDIVAFRHPRRGYHTGIYVGDGKFIHSPHRRSSVRITSLDDPYFSKSFLGARRVNVSGGDTLVVQAESRLDEYNDEKVVRELTKKRKNSVTTKSDNKPRNVSRHKSVHVASNDTPNRNKTVLSPKTQSKPSKPVGASSTQSSGSKKVDKAPEKNKSRQTSTSSAEKRKPAADSKKISKKTTK